MQNLNNALIYPEECSLLPELFLFDTTDLFPSVVTVNALSKKIQQLSLDVTTHGVKIELEKLKRKRLGTNLKRTRQSIISVHHVIKQLQNDYNVTRSTPKYLR